MRRQMRSHHIPYLPVGWLVLHYIERTIEASFDAIAPCNTICQLTCPVLLVHGEQDDTIPLADALRIYNNRQNERTELLMLPDTGHDSSEAISIHAGALVEVLRRCGAGSVEPLA